MRDTSFVALPIRDHAFLSRRFSKVRSAKHSFRARASRRRSCSSPLGAAPKNPRPPALAGLHEVLGPSAIQALGNDHLAAQLGNAVITAQAFQHDPHLVLGRKLPPGPPLDVLDDPLIGDFDRRFFQGVLGFHLRSFVTATKPQHSLHHNLKSVP